MTALEWMIQISFLLLMLALGCGLFRIIKGPSLPDRVVALDIVAMAFAGVMVVFAFQMKQPVFLDVLLVFAIVLFFGTVALGRYLERKVKENGLD